MPSFTRRSTENLEEHYLVRMAKIETQTTWTLYSIVVGALLMVLSLMGLRDQVVKQNGRVTKVESQAASHEQTFSEGKFLERLAVGERERALLRSNDRLVFAGITVFGFLITIIVPVITVLLSKSL